MGVFFFLFPLLGRPVLVHEWDKGALGRPLFTVRETPSAVVLTGWSEAALAGGHDTPSMYTINKKYIVTRGLDGTRIESLYSRWLDMVGTSGYWLYLSHIMKSLLHGMFDLNLWYIKTYFFFKKENISTLPPVFQNVNHGRCNGTYFVDCTYENYWP